MFEFDVDVGKKLDAPSKRKIYDMLVSKARPVLLKAKDVCLLGLCNWRYGKWLRDEFPNIRKVTVVESKQLRFMYRDLESLEAYNIVYVEDNRYTEVLEGLMKFDCIIQNPPYQRNLHLKILAEAIKHLKDDGMCVCLHPGMWIQFPYRKHKPLFMQGKICSIDLCLKDDMAKAFDACFANDLVITTLKTSNGKSIEDFNCFAMNGRFVRYADIVNGIFSKITSKMKADELEEHIVETPASAFPLRIKYGIPLTDFNPGGGSSKFKIVSEDYTGVACSIKPAGHTAFIDFNTEEERHNCWKALLLLFSKFCIALNETMAYLPWLGDAVNPRTKLKGYKGEWTNDDLYKFFNITPAEQKVIEDSMEKYKQ